jgi:hypothetical protein
MRPGREFSSGLRCFRCETPRIDVVVWYRSAKDTLVGILCRRRRCDGGTSRQRGKGWFDADRDHGRGGDGVGNRDSVPKNRIHQGTQIGRFREHLGGLLPWCMRWVVMLRSQDVIPGCCDTPLDARRSRIIQNVSHSELNAVMLRRCPREVETNEARPSSFFPHSLCRRPTFSGNRWS